MAVATRLDGGSEGAKDLVQCSRCLGIELGIGRQYDEVGTKSLRRSHRHTLLKSRQSCLGGERHDSGPVSAGRCYRQGPGSQLRCDQPFEGRAKGGRIDEQD